MSGEFCGVQLTGGVDHREWADTAPHQTADGHVSWDASRERHGQGHGGGEFRDAIFHNRVTVVSVLFPLSVAVAGQ